MNSSLAKASTETAKGSSLHIKAISHQRECCCIVFHHRCDSVVSMRPQADLCMDSNEA